MNIIQSDQFTSPKDIEPYFIHADLMANPYKNIDPIYMLRGKVIALLFLEKSTRTKYSFEVAAKRLGCSTIDFTPETSSLGKGESIEDTIKVLSGYVDAMIIRHNDQNIIRSIPNYINTTVINAGGGSEEHPTQALIDLYTIKKEIGKIHGLSILFYGDLKFNRSVKSLLNFLKLYKCVNIFSYSPNELEINDPAITQLNKEALYKVLPYLDVVYLTRYQQERYPTDIIFNKTFFSKNEVDIMRKSARIMHPLPRTDEMDKEIDKDSRAVYFKQSNNGLFVRMAVLYHLLKQRNDA